MTSKDIKAVVDLLRGTDATDPEGNSKSLAAHLTECNGGCTKDPHITWLLAELEKVGITLSDQDKRIDEEYTVWQTTFRVAMPQINEFLHIDDLLEALHE